VTERSVSKLDWTGKEGTVSELRPHRMYGVQRFGLLLPMFCNRVSLFDSTTSCAKTDESIEMPFRLWTRVGPRNHVLGGARIFPGERAVPFGGGAPCDATFRQNSLTTC